MFKDQAIVQAALNNRNERIANFWLSEPSLRMKIQPEFNGRKAIMVDAEDTFTAMIAQQLKALGWQVSLIKWHELLLLNEKYDLIVMGPGPGDPRSLSDPRILNMRATIRRLLEEQYRFLAVCLSHQLLSIELGLELIRRAVPNQGVQREVDLFGNRELLGFYNTYVAQCEENFITTPSGEIIEVCRDHELNEVHALRSKRFFSIQFHAESLLSRNGIDIMSSNLKKILSL